MLRKIIGLFCAVMISVCILPFSAVHAENIVPAAVLTAKGDLIFFNTMDQTVYTGQSKSVIDTDGIRRTGRLYMPLKAGTEFPFMTDAKKVKRVYTAEGQTVRMPADMSQYFCAMYNLREFDGNGMDTSGVVNMHSLFDDCDKMYSLNLSTWDTSSVKDMGEMFQHCNELGVVDMSNFDTSAAEDMDYMFRICGIQTLILGEKCVHMPQDGDFGLTGEWTNGTITLTARELKEQYPSHIPEWCGTWKRVRETGEIVPAAVLRSDGDLIFFNTDEAYSVSAMGVHVADVDGNVYYGEGFFPLNDGRTDPFREVCDRVKRVYVAEGQTVVMPEDMSSYFAGMSRLTSFDGTGMDTSHVTNMASMFNDDTLIRELDLSIFDTSNVTDMSAMFEKTLNLKDLDLSSFDTSKANMEGMFHLGGPSHALTVGEGFTVWPTGTYSALEGTWTNGTFTLSAEELAAQYPSHIPDWCGTWTNTGYSNRDDFVWRMYDLVLNRTPDPNGYMSWTGDLRSQSKNAADLVCGFFLSQEFTNRELGDDEFVEICYQALMDRNYDEGGRAGWIRKLENGMSRTYVLKGFVNSQEFANLCSTYGIAKGSIRTSEPRDVNEGITSFVARCYREVLGRRYDTGGINTWCRKILNASNKKQEAIHTASIGFFHSPEFIGRNTTNEEYVTILYHTFLDREPESSGYKDWTGRLARGTGRDSVMRGFADSAEFAKILARYGIR